MVRRRVEQMEGPELEVLLIRLRRRVKYLEFLISLLKET